MLQDTVRTELYRQAITRCAEMRGALVLDVGAGSGIFPKRLIKGILSFFAVQAGAKTVYAVEASAMAKHIKRLLSACDGGKNAWLRDKVQIEKPLQIPQVDVLISEPLGVLLVHERMLESFLVGRDKYLKPGGVILPTTGTIQIAPVTILVLTPFKFTDSNLWAQTMSKVRFWEQNDFCGIDLSPLADDARDEIFGQPIVGFFDHRLLVGPACCFDIDFRTAKIEELHDILIPIDWEVAFTGNTLRNLNPGIIHGIAGWFDCDLYGTLLSTAPAAEKTHWQQARFLLPVNAYDRITGYMHLKVNESRSYDIEAELMIESMEVKKRRGKWALHQQTYWYGSELPTESLPEHTMLYAPL